MTSNHLNADEGGIGGKTPQQAVEAQHPDAVGGDVQVLEGIVGCQRHLQASAALSAQAVPRQVQRVKSLVVLHIT